MIFVFFANILWLIRFQPSAQLSDVMIIKYKSGSADRICFFPTVPAYVFYVGRTVMFLMSTPSFSRRLPGRSLSDCSGFMRASTKCLIFGPFVRNSSCEFPNSIFGNAGIGKSPWPRRERLARLQQRYGCVAGKSRLYKRLSIQDAGRVYSTGGSMWRFRSPTSTIFGL